ncbi:Nitrogen regulation protein NtrY [hydrothermal vent metagenome]|uniref:histidine kinase n=1 Tax=hydrothermal vent metagenome TaxID=652676 RepID=A0A3B0UAS1_9ZZZZ
MKNFINRYLFLIIASSCFTFAGVLENNLIKKHPEKHLLSVFQKKILEKEKKLNTYLDEITNIITAQDFDGSYFGSLHPYNKLFQEDGYGFIVYEGDEMRYWSDQAFSFQEDIQEIPLRTNLTFLRNGYYLTKCIDTGRLRIIGLILIKYDYSHENNYLKNDFQKSFNLPPGYVIVEKELKNSYPVTDDTGQYLFSVLPMGEVLCTTSQLYFPGIIYLIGLLILLIYFRKEFKRGEQAVFFKLFVLGAGLFLIYWLHILFKVPYVLYYLNFFSPIHFAYSMWLPSLGDYFLASLFFCFWALNFYFDFHFKPFAVNTRFPLKVIVVLFLFLCAGLFLLADKFINILIYNSSVSFMLNRITDLSFQSAIGFFSIGMILMGLILITIRIINDALKSFKKWHLTIGVAGAILLLAAIQLLFYSQVTFPVLLLFLVFIFLTVFLEKRYYLRFSLSYLIILISIISLYTSARIYTTTTKKEREVQKLLAVNLVTEHDPAAEFLLKEIQNQINVDARIPELMIPPYKELEDYISNTYFNGFFRKYDLQITTCVGSDSLDIQPENITVACFPFFEEMIAREGLQIPGTNFFFMDKMNGRISYFGKLFYPLSADSIGVAVFLELVSSLTAEGLGYPELLMDKSMIKPESYKRFSYAKYYDGQLVDQHGAFHYNFDIQSYNCSDEEFSYISRGNYEHLIYHTKGDNYVIISRSIFTFLDYLISFPYLFVFYFLFVLLLLLVGNPSIRRKHRAFDLKFKIQASIISIVFFSLLIVAIGTIFYNIREYKLKHQADLNEKMKSINEEIYMRLHLTDSITDDTREWLYRELTKLSNIFRTDINIFGIDGELVATSRQEIYTKGLVSTKINSEAYYELFYNYKINYFQPEKIGELSYLSAYKPIINNTGKYLGFINLPYFTRQDKHRQEISTFIVAFINLYVILFLASIIVAVFISNQITRPLTLIRENLRKMELGKRNEPIQYGGDDEIGSLIKEYNKKVNELATSAELLARSERESAWREMAKQIAHEIKNPLTPMKLNIQHLQRSIKGVEQKDKYFERLTKNLIEQIDNLSEIATEFSNFAKIPTARNHVFNLSERMIKVIDLFKSHDKASIRFEIESGEDIKVKADTEQLSRALINLIKNGIQAIPPGVHGEIFISLSKKGHNALIKVKDNGVGIPEETRGKLFSPSFTTKTSGMGLGLSIVKGIVENFSGMIWFETEINKGSTFFIEIPIYEDENNTS